VPRLLSSAACHYEVEWLTEYACPANSLVSHNCQLTVDQHGIRVDLTPLASGDCYNTHTHTCLTAFFRDYPGEPVPER